MIHWSGIIYNKELIVVLITIDVYLIIGLNLACKCGFECENCYHFFMECSLYDNIRQK
jgi:hypothetical protein